MVFHLHAGEAWQQLVKPQEQNMGEVGEFSVLSLLSAGFEQQAC